jgi:pantetheine-phosphate adenylyltransferase
MKKLKAVYPGSFDPVTLGHIDLVTRSSDIFDQVVVGVADNPRKKALFTKEERVDFIKEATKGLDNVSVVIFETLLVEFASSVGAKVIIKGLRAVSDFDYELQMSFINRRLASDLETMFLMPSEEYSFVSSSLIKEIAAHKGDISSMVPKQVENALSARLATLNDRA